MPGLWHWKHLLSRVSLPGASGNPGAWGFCCAGAMVEAENRTSEAQMVFFMPVLSVDADTGVLHDLGDLGHLAPYHLTELLRRSGRDLEAERGELVAHFNQAQDFNEVRIDFCDDRRRRAGGREKAGPGGVVEAGDADFAHRREIGHCRRALRAADGERADAPALEMREYVRHALEHDRNLPRDDVVEGWPESLVRHVHEIDARGLLEHLHRHVLRAAVSAGSVVDLAGIRLRLADKLLHRRGWKRRMHYENDRDRCGEGDRREVARRIVGELRVERG